MIDIRCSRDGFKCGGCPIIKECEHIGLTEEIDVYSLYEKGRTDAIDKVIKSLKAQFIMQNNPNSKFVETIVLHRDFIDALERLKEQGR